MNNITLDSHHKNMLKKLDKKKIIKSNNLKIKKLKKKLKNKKEDYEMTNEEIEKKYSIILEINNLEKENKEIENNDPKVKYFLDTMDILEKYYSKPNEDEEEKKDEITIIDYIQKKDSKKNNISKFVNGKKKILRKQIYFEYLDKVDKSNKKGKLTYVKNYTFCDNCNVEKILITNESLYVCEKCGECNSTIIETEKTSYKDNLNEISNFSYKRYNHFCEWLNQFQGIETISIPIKVFNKIKIEINKQKLDVKKIDSRKMRNILKKINETKYYENINYILNKLNNKPAPKFTKSVEGKLKIMFKKCQEPFNKVCPPDRKNFLSYSYAIRKFLEILNEDKYIEEFPLLKSREKLYEQDLIWKKMCEVLEWKFIPSI